MWYYLQFQAFSGGLGTDLPWIRGDYWVFISLSNI